MCGFAFLSFLELVVTDSPDKTNFVLGGALRYAPLQIFGPTLRSTQIFVSRARSARQGKISREMLKSLHTRESGLSGADRNSQKNDLLLACFWPRPNVVSRAARIVDLCLSPVHATEYGRRPVRPQRMQRSTDGARYRLQHCCECARSAGRNFRVSLRRTAEFRPPGTPCQQIFALRYENLFCRKQCDGLMVTFESSIAVSRGGRRTTLSTIIIGSRFPSFR